MFTVATTVLTLLKRVHLLDLVITGHFAEICLNASHGPNYHAELQKTLQDYESQACSYADVVTSLKSLRLTVKSSTKRGLESATQRFSNMWFSYRKLLVTKYLICQKLKGSVYLPTVGAPLDDAVRFFQPIESCETQTNRLFDLIVTHIKSYPTLVESTSDVGVTIK